MQEHLFIVTELLRANLYEFQKYNQESGGEPYFTLHRLQVLFPNEAVVMLLARMIGLLGPIDMDMLQKGQETHKYFTKEYDLYYINEEANQLEYIIPEESSLEHHLQISDPEFVDFLRYSGITLKCTVLLTGRIISIAIMLILFRYTIPDRSHSAIH
ncbi:hypothetical protein Sango_2657800 [Sesamum angolense]|uniref:Uncharacterized protein n=1 Tax=Sesamum angolense TaxID=2727404 RepID=A0AAE2BH40_9LAMI|nr:hypothetical protein Sango_2657800 [Sesamum angolense]